MSVINTNWNYFFWWVGLYFMRTNPLFLKPDYVTCRPTWTHSNILDILIKWTEFWQNKWIRVIAVAFIAALWIFSQPQQIADDCLLFDLEVEVPCSAEKRLSDFDVKHGSTLSLVVGLHGGIWPTEEDLAGRSRTLIPSSGLKTTVSPDNPDSLFLVWTTAVSVLWCHAVTLSVSVEEFLLKCD